jgi:hypothetical protein
MRSAFGPLGPEGFEVGALALSQQHDKFAVADHVHTFITGWIGISEAQIEGSKLPNYQCIGVFSLPRTLYDHLRLTVKQFSNGHTAGLIA